MVVLSWNGRDDTLQCLASLAGVDYAPLEVIVVDNGSSDGSPEAVEAEFPDAVVIRMGRNAGFSGGVNAGIEAAIGRGAARCCSSTTTWSSSRASSSRSSPALEPGVAAACSQILFAESPDRVWYAGATFRPRRGHHGATSASAMPPARGGGALPVDCACGGAMLMSRGASTRSACSTRSCSPTARISTGRSAPPAGRRVVVVPASIVRHRVSASTGGESSPTSLYYDVRNGLVVSERYAPLGRFGTSLRRAESVLAHLAQGALSYRRVEATRAVMAGWRDARRRRLGRRSM